MQGLFGVCVFLFKVLGFYLCSTQDLFLFNCLNSQNFIADIGIIKIIEN